MPSTHVLKTADGRTVTEVLEIQHTHHAALVTVRGSVLPEWKDIDRLTIVPRAELLAGQVLFA